MDRADRYGLINTFLKFVDKLLNVFKDYDFRCILSDKDQNG